MPGVWFLWSEKKKYYIITFQKEKENTFTLLIILILKSLQKEHRVFTLRKCIRLDLHTAGVSKNSQKYATNKSVEFWPFGPQNIKNRVFRFELFSDHLPLCQSAEIRCWDGPLAPENGSYIALPFGTVLYTVFCPQKVDKTTL